MDGGQSFCWEPSEDGSWDGVVGRNHVQVRLSGSGRIEFRCKSDGGDPAVVDAYFADALDWDALRDALPWRSDPHLKTCMDAFPGLRILRQPFGETLFSFLCSTAKQIVQIKQCCREVARRLGEDLGCGTHAWPGWVVLAEAGEEVLRECRLGYRARYVWEVARILADQPDFEERLQALDYPQAKAMLMELPGVGAKVADCVLLFGAGRLEAFPVDTWVAKVMTRVYGLEGWSAVQIAQFGRAHFGAAAGVAQQFLFAYERRNP